MKDVNKILAKAHFKFQKIDGKKQHIFAETCLYKSVGSLPVMPSLLPHVLWGRSQVSLFFSSVVWPCDSNPVMVIYAACRCIYNYTCLQLSQFVTIILSDNENIIKRMWTKTMLLPDRNNNHSLTDKPLHEGFYMELIWKFLWMIMLYNKT